MIYFLSFTLFNNKWANGGAKDKISSKGGTSVFRTQALHF